MKLANAISTSFAALAALSLGTSASAQVALDFVNVGDPGNPHDPSTGYGAVSYEYRIGKYEVTLHQYTAFLNAVARTDTYGLYNQSMATDLNIAGIARSGVSPNYSYSVIGDGNRPVTCVSWFDAARFTNWLHNGQPNTGNQTAETTEQGAYALNGGIDDVGFSKGAGAQYWIPSENEWYKAAYYQPLAAGGDADGYWLYPTRSNAIPNCRNGSVSDANSGNFFRDDGIDNGFNGGYAVSQTPGNLGGNKLTAVGAFTQARSYYGTFDQGGNVEEWNDEIPFPSSRGVRGGAWATYSIGLESSSRFGLLPLLSDISYLGFRVASVPPPAPAVLFQHTGSTDPASEGWQANGFSAGATTGPINDGGTPAWFSNDTSTAGGSYRFFLANVSNAQAAAATSLGWTLTTRVRVTAISTTTPGSTFAAFSNGPRTFLMFYAGRAGGDMEVSLFGGPSITVAGGMNAYHVYSLVYDPVAGSADLFVDGVERLSNYTGIAIPEQVVDWGTGSSGFDGSANFNLVKFSVGRPLSSWRELQGLLSNGSQDLANPSRDGVANLLKYAFNLAPNAGDLATPNIAVLPANGTAGLPAIGRDAQGRVVVEFVRRHAETRPGIAYAVETGDDLANLQPLSLSGATVAPINALWERVTVTDPVVTGKRFGRVRVQASETYANNFNAGLGTASLRRDAVWTNQAVQLTDALNGQMGAVVLDGIEAWPAVSGFTAKFNATLGPTTSGFPADGLSFSVGNLGTDAWAEAGPPTSHHLSIGFDTHENGTGILEATGIHLWVNGTHVAYNFTNPYINEVAVPVEVRYDAATGVTVIFNGNLIFNNVAVPGFSFQPGDRFGFGGRTGLYNERKVIDDVEITTR